MPKYFISDLAKQQVLVMGPGGISWLRVCPNPLLFESEAFSINGWVNAASFAAWLGNNRGFQCIAVDSETMQPPVLYEVELQGGAIASRYDNLKDAIEESKRSADITFEECNHFGPMPPSDYDDCGRLKYDVLVLHGGEVIGCARKTWSHGKGVVTYS